MVMDKVSEEMQMTLKERGGTWAAYRNEAMDSAELGMMIFLEVGEGCTYETPPKQAPDGSWGMGWKYLYLGMVNLETGEIEKAD
jgi:hypothetical protein